MDEQYLLAVAREEDILNDIQSHLEEIKLTDSDITSSYERTSTPIFQRHRRCSIEFCLTSGYKKWCNQLHNSRPSLKIRGVSSPLNGIVSGNLIPFSNVKVPVHSEIDYCEKNPANERIDYHSEATKKLLLSVLSDHCKSLVKKTISLVKPCKGGK